MRNLFKKSLACCLAIALCLSAMVGVLTVSADVTGSISVATVTIEPNSAETVGVDVTISATGLSEAILTLDTEAGDITAVASKTEGVTAALNSTATKVNVRTAGSASVDEAVITLTIALTDAATEAEYPVNAAIYTAATAGEELITLDSYTAGAIIIASAECKHEADPIVLEAVAATCTETGLTEGSKCSVCDEILVAQEEVPALGHTEVALDAVDPTCTETGLTAGVKCSVCDAVLTAQEEVPALGHTAGDAVVENEVAADCDTAGSYDSVIYCSVCDAEMSRETIEVDATGHTPATAVEENRTDATCEVAGSYDSVVYCSVCNAEISRETITLEATGHSYTYVDNGDGTHTATCANGCTGTVEHEYVDNTCACGLNSSITITANINVTATVNLRFLASSIPTCDDFYMEISHAQFDADFNFAAENYVEKLYMADLTTASGGRYYTIYTKLGFTRLNVPVTVTIHCLDAEDKEIYHSNALVTTATDAAKTGIANATAAQAKVKTAYTDIVNLASEAQLYFTASKPNSDLATKIAVPNADLVGGTPTADIAKEDLAQYNTTSIPEDSKITFSNPAMNMTSNPVLRFMVSGAANYADETFKVVVSYTGNDDKERTATWTKADMNTSGSGTSIRYYQVFDDIALFDSNMPVTCTVYDGETVLGSITYSIETAIYNTSDSSAAAAAFAQIAKVGASARAYFNYN